MYNYNKSDAKNNWAVKGDGEYIWYFLATPISPFMRGFNRTNRWLYEEQDKYEPDFCDLYFRPNNNHDILIKVENINCI